MIELMLKLFEYLKKKFVFKSYYKKQVVEKN